MPTKKKKSAPKRKPSKKKKIIKKTAKTIKKKKPALKKPAKKAAPKKAAKAKPAERGAIGKITHFFPHVNAAVIALKAPLKVGDQIRVKGHTTNLTENVSSMQIDHKPINEAKKGDEIGLLVTSRVRAGDTVYKEKP
jgi:putative protease